MNDLLSASSAGTRYGQLIDRMSSHNTSGGLELQLGSAPDPHRTMATTTCRASLCCARAQQQQHHQQRSTQATPAPAQQKLPHGRRQLLGGLAAVAAAVALRPARPAAATGIESIDLPQLQIPEALAQKKARNQDIIDSAEKSFQESGAPPVDR